MGVAVGDYPMAGGLSVGGLTVVMAVADSRNTRLEAVPPTATVLGVSADAATAEPLAWVGLSASSAGVDFGEILVADPDPGDRTTGRLLQLSPSAGPRPSAQHRHVARLAAGTQENRR